MTPEGESAPKRELETNTAELYEHAPCAHISTLPDGMIVRANQTFYDWIGAPAAEIASRVRFQSLLTVGSRIYYETHYAPLLQMQGVVNEIALDVRRTDGSVRPVVASARQVNDAGGRAGLHRIALFDSTSRRRYEQELLEARKRAEAAARELAKADAQKSEFIAMLAHELRNPLAPIASALELLRRSKDSRKVVDEAAGVLQRQVTQMVRLVDDLWDISRAGQNRLSIQRAQVELASVVSQALEASAPLLRAAGLHLSARMPREPISVHGDAARLAQVIGNILNNASKFTPRGGTVSIVLERTGADAVIAIRDTGIGMEPSELRRVFEMFMQGGAPSESRSGLGIGLTLARTLVERHGGTLTARSEGPGRGTEFVICLPALSAALSAATPPAPAAVRQPPAETPGQPRRVLVVDDNVDSAQMMAVLLGYAGHEVRTAHDGLEALDVAQAFQPHVALLDIGLPGIDGYEAATQIRRKPGLQPVLVALTGWGQEEDRRKAVEAGFDHHLVKPVDHDALLALVGAAARASQLRGS